jgi:hypothetical protein
MLGILEKSSADTVSSIESKSTAFTTDDIRKWLSVDPLADKYPNISPYAYCGWNPVKYVDPDGRKIVVGTWYGRLFAKFGVNNFEAKTIQNLQNLKSVSSELNNAISSMVRC